MKELKILNIIVCGTGGQGVLTLSNQIRELAFNKGYQCEGASFKGGAQRMGSIHTELRIKIHTDLGLDLGFGLGLGSLFSSQIPKGSVDVLIGLEPWETLRFAHYCHPETKVIANTHEEKLYTERYQKEKLIDPIENLTKIFKHLILKDYTSLSKKETNTIIHTNTLILLDTIDNNLLPFTKEELTTLKNT